MDASRKTPSKTRKTPSKREKLRPKREKTPSKREKLRQHRKHSGNMGKLREVGGGRKWICVDMTFPSLVIRLLSAKLPNYQVGGGGGGGGLSHHAVFPQKINVLWRSKARRRRAKFLHLAVENRSDAVLRERFSRQMTIHNGNCGVAAHYPETVHFFKGGGGVL